MRTLVFLFVGAVGLAGVASGQASVPELVKKLKHKDRAERLLAANELSKLGAGAAGAATALGAALGDKVPEVGNAAADALAKIGKPAVPVVEKALADPDSLRSALRAAGKLGPLAVGMLPAIMKPWRAGSFDGDAVQSCLLAIGDPAVPHLIEGLQDNAMNAEICKVLSVMGPKAKTAVPALVELLGKRGLSAQESAAEALGRIGDPRAVPALLAAAERGMTKSDTQLSGVTANAVRSLGEIGAEPDTVVPLLLRVLASERRDFMSVRAQAETLLALERFDVRTPAVLEALQAFLDGDPGENRVTAKYVLAKLSRKP